MQNKILNDLVYEICEINIDDVLIHGKTDPDFLTNTRRVLERLRSKKVAVNPRKTKMGLKEVEYVGHLVSATGTSFTPEKCLKVLDFPQPSTQKEMLQFIGLVNYFRDHVPNMTEMAKSLRDMIPQGKYQRTDKLV
jgi:cleavage and polyadenylation specificity factor subunit 1